MLAEEAQLRSTVVEAFLLGVTVGIGITLLALYTQKPGCLATSIGTLAERGRTRRAREEETRARRQRLKAIGFTDEEIDEVLK